jgi:putative redox protein
MTVRIKGRDLGGLRTELIHEPSAVALRTAAPRDNAGDGSSFSPTDLVAAALGSCMLTTMGIVAAREGIPLQGASFSIEKHMRSDPRRIERLPVRVSMPAGLGVSQRRRLEEIALDCPVYQSLRADIAKEVEFVYPDTASGSGD